MIAASVVQGGRGTSALGDQSGVILRAHRNRVRTGIGASGQSRESPLYDVSANSRVEHAAVRPTLCTNSG